MKPLMTVLLVLLPGCAGRLVSVRVDAPMRAVVTLAAGVGTPELVFTTPFVGDFEPVGGKLENGFPLVFDLDTASAAAYGIDHPVRIYARLTVEAPTRRTLGQKVRITPSAASLGTLLRGEVTELESPAEAVPGTTPPASLVMRMVAF